MRQIIQNIQRDESRHVGYGVYLLSRLIAEDAEAGGTAVWDQVEAEMGEMLARAIDVVNEMLAPYGDDIPFGVTLEHFVDFAMGQFQKRYARLEKARTRPVSEVLYGIADRADALTRLGVGGDGAPS